MLWYSISLELLCSCQVFSNYTFLDLLGMHYRKSRASIDKLKIRKSKQCPSHLHTFALHCIFAQILHMYYTGRLTKFFWDIDKQIPVKISDIWASIISLIYDNLFAVLKEHMLDLILLVTPIQLKLVLLDEAELVCFNTFSRKYPQIC